VIIVDNVVAATPPGLGGADPGLTIPTVSVTLANGNLLKAELGGGVNLTLQLDANVLAGTDNMGPLNCMRQIRCNKGRRRRILTSRLIQAC